MSKAVAKLKRPLVHVLRGDRRATGREIYRQCLRIADEMDAAPLSKCYIHLKDIENKHVREWMRTKIFRGLEVYHPYVSMFHTLNKEFYTTDVGDHFWQQELLMSLRDYLHSVWVNYMWQRTKFFTNEPQQCMSVVHALGHLVIPFQDFPRPDMDLKFGLREYADTDDEDDDEFDEEWEPDETVNLLMPEAKLPKKFIGPPVPVEPNPLYNKVPTTPVDAPNTRDLFSRPASEKIPDHNKPARHKKLADAIPNTADVVSALLPAEGDREPARQPEPLPPGRSSTDAPAPAATGEDAPALVLPREGAPLPPACRQLSYCAPKGVVPTAIPRDLSAAGRSSISCSASVEAVAKGIVPPNHHVQIESSYRNIQKWHRRQIKEVTSYDYTEQVTLREPGTLPVIGKDGKTAARLEDFTQMEVSEEEKQQAWGNLRRPSVDEVVQAIKPGMVLIAHPSPVLGEQYFYAQQHNTGGAYHLMLVVEHDSDGTVGLIMGHHLGSGFDKTWNFRQRWKEHEICQMYRGGAVEPNAHYILHDTKSPDGKCKHVSNGVKLSHNPDTFKNYVEMFNDLTGESKTVFKSHHYCRVFKGCTYWYPGVLADQIYAGWWVAAPNPNVPLLMRDYFSLTGNLGWVGSYLSQQGEYETMVRDGNLQHMSWEFNGFGKW